MFYYWDIASSHEEKPINVYCHFNSIHGRNQITINGNLSTIIGK